MAVSSRKHNMEDDDLSPFYQLQKSQVLHEAKVFNVTPLDSRKCCSVLTELLCLLSQGEVLSKDEGTTLFFSVTKIFQAQDPQLRRLLYLVIKELNKTQDDAFIVICSLEKDINGSVELFKANALRVHSQVIDSSMLEQRSRLFRQAIVNKNSHIASSALCSGIRMFNKNSDVIRRWVNEVRESTKSASKMVSFHGLHLLYKIHQHDRHAVLRLVTSMINNPPDSPLSRVLLIRYAFSCIMLSSSNVNDKNISQIIEFIKDQIKQYKNPMVMFEAAKCLCYLKTSQESDLIISINVLQEFLNSPRPIQRFSAVRALSSIVNRFNNILTPSCIVDLEHLITDSNRNIATLSITTLLKTTAEYSIERLLSSISEFMTEISDELKIVLIDSIQKVCKKFPKKYECLLNFLSLSLREEGGYLYKNKIVDCMLLLMADKSINNNTGKAKEFGLDSLCEFIEDCEYPLLSVRILYLIGQLSPTTQYPSKYIRFIYNRVLLELPIVRAAAVSCLCKCAVKKPILKNDIYTLLIKSLNDEDDEVRDRATLYCELLRNFKQIKSIKSNDDDDDNDNDNDYVDVGNDRDDDNKAVDDDKDDDDDDRNTNNIQYRAPKNLVNIIEVEEMDCSLKDLEGALLLYINDNTTKEDNDEKSAYDVAFNDDDIKDYISKTHIIPTGVGVGEKNTSNQQQQNDQPDIYGTDTGSVVYNDDEWDSYLISKKKDLPDLGVQICSSSHELLTEPEAEYQVEVIKRVYQSYLVFQFNILNTIDGQVITDVYVEIEYDDSSIDNLTCPIIKPNTSHGIALAIIEREDDNNNNYIIGSYECTLKFLVKDDTDDIEFDQGYDDEYTLNELNIYHYDYIYPASSSSDIILSTLKFKDKWQSISKNDQSAKKGILNYNNLQIAVNHIIKCVGLTPVEESNKIDDDNAVQHGLNLIAFTDKNESIAMRAAFILNDDNISYRVAVRCENIILRNSCLQSI